MQDQVTISELSRTFGVSRQTLSRARDKAEAAAVEALCPKPPGRKGKSAQEAQIAELLMDKAQLHKELSLEKKKVQIAQAFLELERKLERGEALPGEEKKRKRKRRRKRPRRRKNKAQGGPRLLGQTTRMAEGGDGHAAGHDPPGADSSAAPKGAD
jgi:hypothetical protein